MTPEQSKEIINVHFANAIIVFEYYDGLEVLTFKQYKSKNYIGLWFEEEEDYISYRYVEISNNTLQKLKLCELDLRSIFEKSESFEIANPIKQGEHSKIIMSNEIKFIRKDLIKKEDLPSSGTYLNFLQNK